MMVCGPAECVDDHLKGDISMPATQACVTCYEMLIDGEFVSSTKTLQVVNPTTEQVISEVPDGTVEDVNRAVLKDLTATEGDFNDEFSGSR